MPVHIVGAKSYKQRVTGDIVSSYQWVNDEPAMILWPKNPRMQHPGAFVICLSAAWKYTDIKYLIAQAHEAAEVMGMDTTKYIIQRIADVILDGLPDLCEMPPDMSALRDNSVKEAIGEMTIKDNGRLIHAEEITVPDEVIVA